MRRGAVADLPARLSGLRDALEAADGHLPAADLAPARGVLAKAGARTALGDATVVALAGATGSGKSTLFNALVGEESRDDFVEPATDRADNWPEVRAARESSAIVTDIRQAPELTPVFSAAAPPLQLSFSANHAGGRNQALFWSYSRRMACWSWE